MASESNSVKHVKALPYDLPYMTDELKKRAKLELFEDEDTRVHSLKLFRSMLKDEKNLNFMDDDKFLLMFLRARKFDVKRAFNLIKTFYTVKQKHAELFQQLDINAVKRALKDSSVGFLSYRDAEGCCIVILNIENWNLNINTMADNMRVLGAGLLHAIDSPSTQVAGIKGIVDCKGLTIPHLKPKYLWLLAETLQNCVPARFRAVHIVNENHLWSYVWQIIKPFMSRKVKDRLYFHGSNVEELHTYFSPSILPAEYKGELPKFDNSEWSEKLLDCFDKIKYINSFGWVNPENKSN